jgi:hypothetical protein
MLTGVYRTPALFVRVRGVYTNTLPVDAYRGAGRPEAAYLLERLVDRTSLGSRRMRSGGAISAGTGSSGSELALNPRPTPGRSAVISAFTRSRKLAHVPR